MYIRIYIHNAHIYKMYQFVITIFHLFNFYTHLIFVLMSLFAYRTIYHVIKFKDNSINKNLSFFIRVYIHSGHVYKIYQSKVCTEKMKSRTRIVKTERAVSYLALYVSASRFKTV